MERYQNAIVITVIAVFVLLIAGALVYSQRGANVPAQRFRAAPGTERANAQPIYSQRTDRDEGAAVSAPVAAEGTAIVNAVAEDAAATEPVWIIVPETSASAEAAPLSDGPAEGGDLSGDQAAVLLQKAGLAATPAEGLRVLAEGTQGLAAASGIYSAAARMYMRLEPPDPGAALQMMELAMETAVDPEERGEAVVTQAQLLVDGGESERAMAYLETTLTASEAVGVPSVRARLLLGSIYESFGRVEDAKSAYSQAESDAAELLASDVAGADDVYRQSALRLSRFHTSQGDTAAAKDVVDRLTERLAAGGPPPT